MTRPETGQGLVFFTQRTFRSILDSMARPGKTNRVEPFTLPTPDGETPGDPFVAAVSITLLDTEVGFQVSDGRERFRQYLAFQTGARPVQLGEADFVFLTPQDDPALLADAKRGSLNYPERGATIILGPVDLGGGGTVSSQVTTLVLSGPGVPGEASLAVGGLTERHVEALTEINREYPLGVDVILVGGGLLACLPRSVKLKTGRSA